MRTLYSTQAGTGRTAKIAVIVLCICAIMYPIFHTTASQAEITVSANLSAATFPVDQGVQLSITVHGTRSANLQLPETENFDIYQRGKSSQFNMVNGEFSASISISCILQAHQPGKYTIPPITIQTDDTTLTTEPIPFEVTASAQARRQAPAGVSSQTGQERQAAGKTAFIQLIHEKQQSYIGEIIPVEIKAYFKQGLRANLNSTPTLIGDGFVMPQLHDQPRQTQEYIGNTVYNVLSWKTTLSTIKEGAHTIRIELDATQLIPQRRTSTSVFGSRSPFDDDFFDSVFGGYAQKPINVMSEDINLEILPLPEEGRPDNFTGAIGDFTLTTEAEPTQVETGEPITLTITVNGTGNFDRVEAPTFPDIPGWKTYSANSEYSPDKSKNPVNQKKFEQAIVAQDSSITEIPSLEFSYFDPKKGMYITRKSSPISIHVTGKTTSVQTPVISTPSEPKTIQLEEDAGISGLAPLKLESGRATSTIMPLYKKPFFLVLVSFCLFAILCFCIFRVLQARAEGRPEERLKRQRNSALQQSLSLIESARNTEDGTAFLAACRTTIQQHLGALWNCEPATITRADLAERLPQSPELLKILTAAEQAAYGGASLTKETMDDYTSNLKTTLEKLV